MPTSRYGQINQIVEVIAELNPSSVLDIGCGFGKYGVLAREYLELWGTNANYEKSSWKCRIDAIEGYAAYISPLHHYIYNNVYIGNVTEIISTVNTRYELVLLIDVFEHIEREKGCILIDNLLQITDSILVCVPKRYAEQEAIFGNTFEIHRTNWTAKDLQTFGPTAFIPHFDKRICIIGRTGVNKWHSYNKLRIRRIIKKRVPLFAHIYRLIKGLT